MDLFNRLSAQLDRRDELKKMIKSLADDGKFNGLDWLTAQRIRRDAELAIGRNQTRP